ncbi:MAG: WbqC family protein [Bacteroidales bacterium]|nr:WbqC family protein [Bacteroidales bacterium]
MNSSILFASYFPPISYFIVIKNSSKVIIEANETFQRQTIRNRCFILSANGIQKLIVPVTHPLNKKIKDIEINYKTNWVNNHINAIKSAYGKSPYFLFYSDIFFKILLKKPKFLFDLNIEILFKILEILNLQKEIIFSEHFIKPDCNNINDYRLSFSKKNMPFINTEFKKYIQTFSDRFNFIQDLSIIDLLFNCGKESILYL